MDIKKPFAVLSATGILNVEYAALLSLSNQAKMIFSLNRRRECIYKENHDTNIEKQETARPASSISLVWEGDPL